ncbi:MAG: hypothetical protein J6B72_00650 [Clostridia bacterium]|nr:hypothetical protein [Clostridia bacterium]
MKKRITAILIATVMLFSGMITVNAETTSSVIESTAESVGYSAERITQFTGTATTITEDTDFTTLAENYIIDSQEGMNKFVESVNDETTTFKGCTVYLTANNLEVNTPIGNATGGISFKGSFDGQGNTVILDMTLEKSTGAGLFGYIADGATTISNVIVTGTIGATGTAEGIGGIVGACNYGPTISNCMSMVTIDGTAYNCGGILGKVGGSGTSPKIMNCTNLGSVTGKGAVGGILGATVRLYNSTKGGLTVSNCVNYGTIAMIDSESASITYNGTYAGCGGIVGYIQKGGSGNYAPAYANISDCYNYGAVSSAVSTGGYKISGCAGILGTAGVTTQIEMSDCYNYGTHTADAFIDKNSKSLTNTIGVSGAWGTIPGLVGSYKEAYADNTPSISVSYKDTVKFTSNADASADTATTETLDSLKQMYIDAYGQAMYDWSAENKIPVQLGADVMVAKGTNTGYFAQTKVSSELDIRLVNAIKMSDKDSIKSLGYYVILTYGNEIKEIKGETDTVFTSVNADGLDNSASDLGGDYIYLANISGYTGTADITVRVLPYVTLEGGATVYSEMGIYTFGADGTLK